MDEWGTTLGSTDLLNLEEKAEVVAALFDGFNREAEAFGYCRAFGSMMNELPDGLDTLEQYLAFDAIAAIRKSPFFEIAKQTREEFEAGYIKRLNDFECPITGLKF
jgi:hypothetical protein